MSQVIGRFRIRFFPLGGEELTSRVMKGHDQKIVQIKNNITRTIHNKGSYELEIENESGDFGFAILPYEVLKQSIIVIEPV